jgi:DNA-binding MarR family transcriptional regulator
MVTDMGPTTARRTPAEEAWAAMRQLLFSQRVDMLAIASEFALSPPQLFALRSLEPDEPAPMSRLAGVLRCDASNVTGIVDRLEDRGLVERRAAPHDRRIKHLLLTDAGVQLRDKIAARMDRPPAGFAALGPAEQRQLRDLLRKVAVANDDDRRA